MSLSGGAERFGQVSFLLLLCDFLGLQLFLSGFLKVIEFGLADNGRRSLSDAFRLELRYYGVGFGL